MPTVSTKSHASLDAAEPSGQVELARRRIDDGFYDRPEVRRTVAALLLKDLARSSRPAGSSHPETA
ncbi:MAG TPA: hypothetical protein VFS09_02830 [Candidatus Eisenbacteria bacterium]|nr:hypothetical protein [Candidatus Eisenbacteria bacterium]